VAIISYDEKPGIQAIATTAPDLPPEPGVHATFAREHEYKRSGTVSLLAGIDLVAGKVHALAKDRHRSREFIEFLELLDAAAYPAQTAIKLILDNHSAHISKETRAWLAGQPAHRFAPAPSPAPAGPAWYRFGCSRFFAASIQGLSPCQRWRQFAAHIAVAPEGATFSFTLDAEQAYQSSRSARDRVIQIEDAIRTQPIGLQRNQLRGSARAA
jgi:DDE superfamily endonuclease